MGRYQLPNPLLRAHNSKLITIYPGSAHSTAKITPAVIPIPSAPPSVLSRTIRTPIQSPQIHQNAPVLRFRASFSRKTSIQCSKTTVLAPFDANPTPKPPWRAAFRPRISASTTKMTKIHSIRAASTWDLAPPMPINRLTSALLQRLSTGYITLHQRRRPPTGNAPRPTPVTTSASPNASFSCWLTNLQIAPPQ